MIEQTELAQVREINRHLPFAQPIEQGEEPTERLFIIARQGAEIPAVGDKILAWTEITHAIVPGTLTFARSDD